LYSDDIDKVLNLASRTALSSTGTSTRETLRNITPQTVITSDLLVEKITSYVEQVRQEVFGKKKPPFDDIADARAWLRRKGVEPLPARMQKKIAKYLKQMQVVRTLVSKLPAVPWETAVTAASPNLEFPGEKRAVELVPPHHDELRRIKDATILIEEATGFNRASVTAFVLTGIAPLLPRVTISKTISSTRYLEGQEFTPFHMTLKINSKDLTFQELKEIYESLRSEFRVKKKKSFRRKDVELLSAVKTAGKPPRKKGTVAYWTSIAEKANFNGWLQAYNAHKRLSDRLRKW